MHKPSLCFLLHKIIMEVVGMSEGTRRIIYVIDLGLVC